MKNKYNFDYYLTRLLSFRVFWTTAIFDIFQIGGLLKTRSAISFSVSHNNYLSSRIPVQNVNRHRPAQDSSQPAAQNVFLCDSLRRKVYNRVGPILKSPLQ